jgi:DNA-binding CsgD family transcriptional regulator
VLFERFAIDALVEAIRTVAAGHVWVPPALQTYMVGQLGDPFDGVLTAREREITRHVACGLRNGEVAEQLAISEQTVKKHLNRICHKLGVRDRVELVLQAGRRDLGGEPMRPFDQPGLPDANGQAVGPNGAAAVSGTRRARRVNGQPADRVATTAGAADARKSQRQA